MLRSNLTRRELLAGAASAAAAACAPPNLFTGPALGAEAESTEAGSQRLSVARLQAWESLGYGMFIHFGMGTFVGSDYADGKAPASVYAPDRLDVGQWVSVARDAGMKYMVLTAKHVAGHCLWPSKCTDYTVANSANKTNVVEEFCRACEKRGVLPGLYYCSWDNHNRFGGRTPSDAGTYAGMNSIPKTQVALADLPAFTTSLYQSFQTAQITELLTQFGPIAEMWLDIPGVLGSGYRTFLYDRMAALQPEMVILMNGGDSDGARINMDYAWPSDLISLEDSVPPKAGHRKWREIDGKKYYLPGEAANRIAGKWFWVAGDKLRPDEVLLKEFQACRAGGVNYLLDVPPDKHGLIPDQIVAALMRLRKIAAI